MTGRAIELEIFECVARGGVRRVTWHIWVGRDWVSAPEFPGARVCDADSQPGVIWRRRVSLELLAGTRLMRVESSPARAERIDPFDYLWKEQKSVQRCVRRAYFQVARSGRLLRDQRRS